MPPSISSISSLGDEPGQQEEDHFKQAQNHIQSQDLANRQHEETASRQRLLAEHNAKSHQQNITDITEKTGQGIRPSRPNQQSWLRDWWLLEIAGILLSLGATVAIILILALYDNKPLPHWKYGITLNAMLSVLSTISKVRSSCGIVVLKHRVVRSGVHEE